MKIESFLSPQLLVSLVTVKTFPDVNEKFFI